MAASAISSSCADSVLKNAPFVMRAIITQMHDQRGPSITVPQFRLLFFIMNHPESSLAHLAEFLALSPPAASRQVDALVRKQLIHRQTDPADRRRVVLTISPTGQAIFDNARQQTRTYLASQLNHLSQADLSQITHAMELLGRVFVPQGEQAHPAKTTSSRSTR